MAPAPVPVTAALTYHYPLISGEVRVQVLTIAVGEYCLVGLDRKDH